MLGRQGLLFRDIHLAVEDIDAADAKLGGFLDDGFHRHFRVPKVPIGISAQPKLDALLPDRMRGGTLLAFRAEGHRSSHASRRGEE